MLICAAGDIHGAINRFYDDVLTFEISLGATFDWVLHVGDFGIWPDPERIDRATRNHDGAGDFSEWLGRGHHFIAEHLSSKMAGSMQTAGDERMIDEDASA